MMAHDAATAYLIKSWDEVFGAPHPKGTHLKKEAKNFARRLPLLSRVQELRAAGEPVDKGLFDKVGLEFGISGTTASELYYDRRSRQIRESIQSIVPKNR
jgi:hypothetical protein